MTRRDPAIIRESVKGITKYHDLFGSSHRNIIASHIRGRVYKRGTTWYAETLIGNKPVMGDNTGYWAKMLQSAIEDVTATRRVYIAGYDLSKYEPTDHGETL